MTSHGKKPYRKYVSIKENTRSDYYELQDED